jgi:hypothetical protein
MFMEGRGGRRGTVFVGSPSKNPILARSSLQNWWPHGRATITAFCSIHIGHSFSELNRRKPHSCGCSFLHIGHGGILTIFSRFKYHQN